MGSVQFLAMGTTCRLETWAVDTGSGPNDGSEVCHQLVEELGTLEARWSRFVPGSDVSRMNRHAGVEVPVASETSFLVASAVSAWELTGGLFDPTVLGALEFAGYPPAGWHGGVASEPPRAHSTTAVPGPHGIVINVELGTVSLPSGVGFDPGGIGKGRAVDLLVERAHALGASGVCVDLGGDVKVSGTTGGPDASSWCVEVDHGEGRVASVVFDSGTAGAVATSSILARRWHGPDGPAHHIIDPRSGRPSQSDLVAVTVVGGEAMWAEVIAKAAVVGGSHEGRMLVERLGLSALATTTRGSVLHWGSIDSFIPASELQVMPS